MKKFALLLLFATLNAAPVGNTSAPKIIEKGFIFPCQNWIDFRLGYEGDFVTDGRMRQTHQGSGRVDTYKQWTNSGTFTLNMVDRFDIYGVFGASEMDANWRFENTLNSSINRIKFETNRNFLWAVGSRAILYEWFNTSLGIGGRYSAANYHLDELKSNGVHFNPGNSRIHWREWQIDLDVSYTICLFTPYIGVKYSNVRAKLRDFPLAISADLTGSNTFKNQNTTGLVLGSAISNGNYFMFNLEARLIDEEAVTVSADLRF